MKSKTFLKAVIIFPALFFVLNVMAQKNHLKDADKAYKTLRFYTAAELYKKAYAKARKEDKPRIFFMIAECHRMMWDMKQCEVWYTKSIKAKYADPIAILYLANAKKSLGKYDEALIAYKDYSKEVPADPRGHKGAESCEIAQEWINLPSRYKIENMAQLNTAQADFAPNYADKKYKTLYFTSTRPSATGGDMDDGWGQIFSDIFETKVDKNGLWSTPSPLPEPLNTKANEGASILNKKGNTLFYTRCGVEKNKEIKCQLYMANKRGNAWSDEKKLNFCVDSFTFGHPAISADEQLIIFSSDMPGGYGGLDLWYSKYDKKLNSFGSPVNMGASINTQDDEMYPFLHGNGSLYFSSDGHIGMGGRDIFKAEKTDEMQWGNITNMQSPINSPADDFAILFEGNKERGYFCSNREGGKGLDDIYSFWLPPLEFLLEGVVMDCENNIPLENVAISLAGSDGSNVVIKTDKSGYYAFGVLKGSTRYINPNTSYIISTDAHGVKSDFTDGYLNSIEKGKITTVGEEESKKFKQDFCLIPNSISVRFPTVLYGVNSAELLPESKDSLDFLYRVLIENPTVVIELAAHTDCRASEKYNLILSKARAQSCVNYLIQEKGISPDRLLPKGYGESQPLRLTEENSLSCDYISTLKTKEEQDAAHQKNRRTVFRVLQWDYSDPNAPVKPPLNPPKVFGEEEYEEEATLE